MKQSDIQGDKIVLSGDNAAHGNVLRLRIGEVIAACDESAVDYHCKVIKTAKSEIVAKMFHVEHNRAEPPFAVTLYQSLPKGGKLEEIIEKSTELGVSEIVPVLSARCVAKNPKSNERLQKIALAAAKQSQRGHVPKVLTAVTLIEAIESAKGHCVSFACHESEQMLTIKNFLGTVNFDNLNSMGFFIGPEGGFSVEEAEVFSAKGIKTVSLGRRRLRTETAGLAVLAQIFYESEK